MQRKTDHAAQRRGPLHPGRSGARFAPKPPPAAVVAHWPRPHQDLLAINTDALEAVLHHSGSSRSQAEAAHAGDDDRNGFAARLELQLWLETFTAEAAKYRSVGVASELLIERSQAAAVGLRNPHLLTTAVAMTLLFHLAPQFKDVAELVTGLVDEVSQSIYISPARCTDLRHASACFGRATYFDAFYTLVEAFHAQKAKATKFAVMQARGQRVLERAVTMCQRGHAKRLLRRWHQLTQHHKHLRRKYRVLFERVGDNSVIERSLHAWRQHAHRKHVAYLTNHNRRGLEALHEAQAEHRRRDEALKAAQFEAQRREKLVKEASENVAALSTRLQATRSSTAVAHSEYVGARKKWSSFAESVFNDTRKVPDDLSIVTWMRDIWCDQLVTPPDSAVRSVSKGRLTPNAILEVLEALADGTGRKRTIARDFAAGLSVSDAMGSLLETAERIVDLYCYIAHDIDPPITTTDIVRGDQAKLAFFVAHIMELAAGGNLGLFQRNSVASATAPVFRSRLRDPPRNGELAKDHELESMERDWQEGCGLVSRGGLHAKVEEQREVATANIVQFGESVEFSRHMRTFFDLVSCRGSVPREHIEAAIRRVVAHDVDLQASWPSTGVTTINEMETYMSNVANAVDVDRVKLVVQVQYDLTVASPLAFLFDIYDEETQLVVRSFEDDLRRAFVVHTEQTTAKFDEAAAAKLVDHVKRNVTLGYSAEELAGLFANAVELVPGGTAATMTAFLSAIAQYFDPNPYVPMHVKLRVFFRTLFRA